MQASILHVINAWPDNGNCRPSCSRPSAHTKIRPRDRWARAARASQIVDLEVDDLHGYFRRIFVAMRFAEGRAAEIVRSLLYAGIENECVSNVVVCATNRLRFRGLAAGRRPC